MVRNYDYLKHKRFSVVYELGFPISSSLTSMTDSVIVATTIIMDILDDFIVFGEHVLIAV